MIYFFQSLSVKTRFLAVLVLGFPVLVFQWLYHAPWALAQLQVLSAGAGVPDALFWYDPDTLRRLFSAWGDDGRLVYLSILWPTDTGFLLAYGVFFGATVLYLLKKANPRGPWWYLLPCVPLAGAGADFLENAFVALASVLPATGWEPVSWLAAGLTAVKWSAFGLTLAILVVGTLAVLVRQARAKVRGVPVLEETSPEPPSKN